MLMWMWRNRIQSRFGITNSDEKCLWISTDFTTINVLKHWIRIQIHSEFLQWVTTMESAADDIVDDDVEDWGFVDYEYSADMMRLVT